MDLGEDKRCLGRARKSRWRKNCGLVMMYCLREEFIFKKKIGVKYERSFTNNNMAIIIATETNSAPAEYQRLF